MITGAAFLPHSPLLLPTIGKEQTAKLARTLKAVQTIAKNIIASKPDTLVVISSHDEVYRDAFSANLHDPYRGNFEEFGDFETTVQAEPDLVFIDRLKRHLRAMEVPFTLTTSDVLSYGTSVPLTFLAALLPKMKIVPMTHSLLDYKMHFDFGTHIKELALATRRRVFLLATGDLSHRHTSDAPGGFAKEGKIFDDCVQSLLAEKNTSGLLQLDPKLVEEAGECAFRPLLILLGVIEKIPYKVRIHSYEAPFGVGYLTASFELP